MPRLSPASEITATGASKAGMAGEVPGVPSPTKRASEDQERAALGPIPESVSAADNPFPSSRADSRAEAQGRRTLSTAFVHVGPDGRLTVELRNGSVLILRNVVMHPKNYCGFHVHGGSTGAHYCGGYAEVAAASPGAAPGPEEPDLALSNPVESPRSPSKRN